MGTTIDKVGEKGLGMTAFHGPYSTSTAEIPFFET